MRKYLPIILAAAFLAGFGVLGFGIFDKPIQLAAAHEPNLAGWAWSSNIGWISFNCKQAGQDVCASSDYGVNLNEASGELSGYAWANPHDGVSGSKNIGWISFNQADLAGCPAAPCVAKLNGTKLEGWARAIRGANGNGGWGGWISLNCETSGNAGTCATSNYFVKYDLATKLFGDFAWGGGDDANGSGDEVIGWMDWDPVGCPGGCDGVHRITDYILNVEKPGAGSGTVISDAGGGDYDGDGVRDINCGPDCTEDYSSPTNVTLQATADAGSVFDGWYDENGNPAPCQEGDYRQNTCTISVNAQVTIQARFRKAACDDGIDNDVPPDGLIDFNGGPNGEPADPGCANVDDDDEFNAPLPQCSNGSDDPDPEDLLADQDDPGCHTDGDAANPASYDPADNDETDVGGCPGGPDCPRCNDGIDNDADGKIDWNGFNDAPADEFCRGNPDANRESFSNDRYEI